MDLMSIRRGLMSQMASGYVPQKMESVKLESAIGTTKAFYDFIYDTFYLEAKTLYLFIIENNSSTNTYKGLKCVKYQSNNNTKETMDTIYVRDANAATTTSDAWVFDVAAGSTVTLYKLP